LIPSRALLQFASLVQILVLREIPISQGSNQPRVHLIIAVRGHPPPPLL
jgi:hypothetical protein